MSDESICARLTGSGVRDIEMQRLHQIDIGYTLLHDLQYHKPVELMQIAACYADLATIMYGDSTAQEVWGEDTHPFWPAWSSISWKPEETAEANAVKAGAFIAAALELQTVLLIKEYYPDGESNE